MKPATLMRRSTVLSLSPYLVFPVTTDKLKPAGENLGKSCNFRKVRFLSFEVKRPSIELKTWPKYVLGFVPLDRMLTLLVLSFTGAQVGKLFWAALAKNAWPKWP
jgi:hypothetical protein